MKLRIVLESAPYPQPDGDRLFDGGQLVIGRSADADWQIDDPDMFVSRRHAILSEEDGRVMVTDASSGGLYIDNAAHPLGTGNSVPVEPGMRLRIGDFTFRVDSAAPGASGPAPRAGMPAAFDFGPSEVPPPPPPERPDTLPDPFGIRSDRGDALNWEREEKPPPRPLDESDPFGLDLRRPAAEPPRPEPETPTARTGRGYFDDPVEDAPAPPPSAPAAPAPKPDIFASWPPPRDPAPTPAEAPDAGDPATPEAPAARDPFGELGASPERARVRAAPPDPAPDMPAPPVDASPPVAPAAPGFSDAEAARLRVALFRGMGIDPDAARGDPEAEMEQIGRSLRALVEGTMMLLRTRAQERQKVRVAQTIISSSDVNPLKFLATTEEALEAVIRARGRGYLDPEAALSGAFRDLADHQVRTWSALQTALRRMVDKFDPAEIAKEMEEVGLIESLMAGGRSAKLWQLYEDRYREIARAAEEQFLGEVGADFRNAYETQRRV
ncbi:type VI secretion system-associated FHA domain protein TagH [Roseivivax isoporae]|uniref:FHA domain-containing protein n=1 Tax=Roseivivax isoporae LMG 25204 TaxID=1449351 RepID=X7FBW0_9RHOB|nr:type VI secretion system-associated FHA domain protein TagH [Roseivivax isoporae]ETX30233.1 hypothetical protein RISW2_15475 [Roseivivax isoporae LMG 25204]